MAEFGYHTIGVGTPDNPGNNVCFMKATSTPASSGTLTQISVHCVIRFGTPQVNLALYSDSAGTPGSLLAGGTAQTAPGSANWVDVPVSVAVTASTQYWFGVLVPGGGGTADIFISLDDPGAVSEFYFKSNGGPPGGSTFLADGSGATLVTNERCSVYGTYTPTAVPVKSFDPTKSHRPAPFKPMGDAFRTAKYKDWR